MSGVAIVAIPSEDDYVWKISSEKIPHMTLLFLGDIQDSPILGNIEQFISHIAETLPRFGLSVDHRGTLGPDNADVLFFEKDHIKKIADARANLLLNDNILAAYNATQQFPEWTPHLTLGYPATPAKADTRDYPGFSWVNFDKLALWIGDFDGPEFQLEMDQDFAMSTTEVIDKVLAHHGVKGQKWGVRRDRGHEGERATTKKIGKLDTKFEKTIATANKGVLTPEFHNAIVRRMNARVDELNDSDKYRDVDMSTYKGKLKADYEKDSTEVIMRSFEDATRQIYGSNASGTKKAVYNRETDKIDIVDKNDDSAKHAAVSVGIPDVSIQLKRNAKGLIASTTVVPLQHGFDTDEVITSILAHHGVKGMHWGVRRSKADLSSDVTVTSRGRKGLQTSGGHGHEASDDAVRAATNRQKAKASGTQSLSNKELQDAVTRMNLEQQYNRLSATSRPQSAGAKFAKDVLTNVGKQQITKLANDAVSKKVGEAIKKG